MANSVIRSTVVAGSVVNGVITEQTVRTTVSKGVVHSSTVSATGPRGVGIPTGGTDGQVLIKDGSGDFSTEWGLPPAGSVAYTPSGDLEATTVQDAIDELDDEKQPLDTELTALAGLTSAADKGIQFTGSGTAGTFDLTTAGKALLDDASASAQRTTLGLVIGTDVQAYSSVLAATTASFTTDDETKLDGIEALADVTDTTNVTAAGALMDSEVDADIKTLSLPANTTISAFGASLIDDADASTARTTLGVAIGTDVQAHDTDLTTLAGLTATTNNFIASVDSAWASRTPAQVRTTLNVEDGADVTDTANVTSAGALMDSEVTNLSQVKAFSASDYATAAQGSAADSALQDIVDDTTPQLGGALDGQGHDLNNLGVLFLTEQADAEADVAGKGQIWVNTATPNELWFTDDAGSDFQLGTFTTTLKSKLDGIEASADVTDATNVAAAGAVMEADTSTASMSFVVDEDDMTSNSATKVPTQQSTKAYVDSSVASAGGGDVSSNTAESVDNEIALFSSTSGKIIKRATGSGIASLASGVLSASTAPSFTDFTNANHDHEDAAGGGQLTGAALNVSPSTDANGWDVISLGTFKMYTKRFTGVTTGSTGANALATTTGGGGTGLAFPVGVAPADANWLVDGITTDGGGRWKFQFETYTPSSTGTTDTWALLARNLTTATITMTGGVAYVIGIGRT